MICEKTTVSYIHKFQQTLINNSGKSKHVVCDIAGVSNNTLTRHIKDLGMKSFHKHDNKEVNRKKKDIEDKPKKQEKVKTKIEAAKVVSNFILLTIVI